MNTSDLDRIIQEMTVMNKGVQRLYTHPDNIDYIQKILYQNGLELIPTDYGKWYAMKDYRLLLQIYTDICFDKDISYCSY